MLWPFNTVPRVMVTQNHKVIFLVLSDCNFTTVSQQGQMAEKIFTNTTLDRKLIFNIYKEIKKLDIKITNNLIKMGYRPKQRTLKRQISNS